MSIVIYGAGYTAEQAALLDTALQPADVGNSAARDVGTTAGTVAAGDDARIVGALPASGGTIGAYTETGATLTPVNGVLTIPLDGKHYSCTPTADITSIVLSNVPTAPLIGQATVYFNYATATRAIASPTAWYWPDKLRTLTATKSGYIVRLDVWTTPAGNVAAATVDLGVPA